MDASGSSSANPDGALCCNAAEDSKPPSCRDTGYARTDSGVS